MLTKTQEQIIAFLLSNPEEHNTIRGIARKLEKSYTLVYNNIVKLEKDRIILKKSLPPATIITLNEFAPTNTLIDIELKRKNEFLDKHPWINVMLKDILKEDISPFFILLVFGSYAKGKEKKDSDIDLLFILQKKEYIKESEDILNKVYTKIKKSPNFVDMVDFKEMIKNSNGFNIGNEAKKHHIILHGAESYYQLLR